MIFMQDDGIDNDDDEDVPDDLPDIIEMPKGWNQGSGSIPSEKKIRSGPNLTELTFFLSQCLKILYLSDYHFFI